MSKYVYVPTKDTFFNTLDQHADTLDGDVKLPLCLLGNEGSGKSALLANWVARRREHKHRDEFLFSHFVGCTTQSLQLQSTLMRLETALKDFFQLREMKVPDTEVELRWSLNRFLEAASKKHFPARIVIIIDGVDRLKAEGAPIGALHWLPAELPHCVRFIVSSVEFERNYRGKKESIPHRTFVELQRRQCPMLRVEQLGANTRSSVINAFANLYPESFELSDAQQFKIVTAQSSAQPMYLRTLLQAFRLATSLTTQGHDQLLEKFLGCVTAHELIDKTLSICCGGGGDEQCEGELGECIGKMFAMIFVARKGLTEEEIWALLKMESRFEPTQEQAVKLMSILKEFTMVVNGLHSFSHEIYREVAYHKFISSREQLLRWHHIMARFFGQLPPCDRKLEGLPYHLEMAGSWSKVKNCLTDIENFLLWWTPKFKFDFLNFWAGLTGTASEVEKSEATIAQSKQAKSKKERDRDMNFDENTAILRPRPKYDIVEEYVKSLDEYRSAKHPSDETVAEIILAVADFLLEFSMLGHEDDADVPFNIHPKVLSEDLASIGVPYIDIDEEGRTSLVFPEILNEYTNKKDENQANDGPGGNDAAGAARAIDEMPLRTAYFFSRWMWIQFPYIALGNCNNRFTAGVKRREAELADNPVAKAKANAANESNGNNKKNKRSGTAGARSGGKSVTSKMSKEEGQELSKSMSSEDLAKMLPPIKFNRKAPRSSSRVIKTEDEQDAANTKFQNRMMALQDNIQNLREEYDFVVQMKSIVGKRLQDQKDTMTDLQRTAESASQFDGALRTAEKREADARAKYESVTLLHKNLTHLSVMCDRHPPNWPALILELQEKCKQDEFILEEIKKRLWEQRFEKQTAAMSYHKVKALVAESVHMHNQLLEFRYEQRKAVTQQAQEDAAALANSTNKMTKSSSRSKTRQDFDLMSPKAQENTKNNSEKRDDDKKMTWEETWAVINSRTGMVEPEAFFSRISNSSGLIDQINGIKKTSEARLEAMKKEVVTVESELEEVRYEASFAGGQSSKEHMKQLAEKQQRLRQTKEKTETAEQLEQNVVAGLAHISDILFIPKSEDDAPVINLVRDIEAVLDTLINEREKQLQQQQGQKNGEDKRESTNAVVSKKASK